MTGKLLSAVLMPISSTQILNTHTLCFKLRPERELVHNPLLPRPGGWWPESVQPAPKPDRHPLHIQQQSRGFARSRGGSQAQMQKLRRTKSRRGPFPGASCPYQRLTERRHRSLKARHKLLGAWRRNSIPDPEPELESRRRKLYPSLFVPGGKDQIFTNVRILAPRSISSGICHRLRSSLWKGLLSIIGIVASCLSIVIMTSCLRLAWASQVVLVVKPSCGDWSCNFILMCWAAKGKEWSRTHLLSFFCMQVLPSRNHYVLSISGFYSHLILLVTR